VADVPPDILDASSDFHEAEVKSYLRFARVNEAIVATNIVAANSFVDAMLVKFLKGNTVLAA
jgi:methylglyoxal synthase